MIRILFKPRALPVFHSGKLRDFLVFYLKENCRFYLINSLRMRQRKMTICGRFQSLSKKYNNFIMHSDMKVSLEYLFLSLSLSSDLINVNSGIQYCLQFIKRESYLMPRKLAWITGNQIAFTGSMIIYYMKNV